MHFNTMVSNSNNSTNNNHFGSTSVYKMEDNLSEIQMAKKVAAYACAQDHIRSGMAIGVGSGSTIKFLIDWLHEKYSSGQLTNISCVPTSYTTRQWLQHSNLPVQSLENLNSLDITIDGADEVDSNLTCIKGGGGCMLQEKVVQSCAKRFILIGDSEKFSDVLGKCQKTIPVEVVPYASAPVKRWITERLGGQCHLRMDQRKCFPVITENSNYIFDWEFPQPVDQDKDWQKVHQNLISLPGVVETGLFINVAQQAYSGMANGTVKVMSSSQS
uniref:ribose-5-phosphate isomerase n=1 Tax=Ditylenchus dipsaci TaxID=166011 RepID=A0A915DGG1_9BILA